MKAALVRLAFCLGALRAAPARADAIDDFWQIQRQIITAATGDDADAAAALARSLSPAVTTIASLPDGERRFTGRDGYLEFLALWRRRYVVGPDVDFEVSGPHSGVLYLSVARGPFAVRDAAGTPRAVPVYCWRQSVSLNKDGLVSHVLFQLDLRAPCVGEPLGPPRYAWRTRDAVGAVGGWQAAGLRFGLGEFWAAEQPLAMVPFQDRRMFGLNAAIEVWSDRSWVHGVGLRFVGKFFTAELGASGAGRRAFDRYRGALGLRLRTRTETTYLLTAECERQTGKLAFAGVAVETPFLADVAAALFMGE